MIPTFRIASRVALALLGLAAPALAQSPTPESALSRLQDLVVAQQERLDQQARQLDELRASLIALERAVGELRGQRTPVNANMAPSPALDRRASDPAAPVAPTSSSPAAGLPTSVPGIQDSRPVGDPTQEVARETPAGAALEAGPVQFRIGGYLALTGIYRSTSSGGNVSTGFGTIPFANTLDGHVSEARLSAQSTRLSLRVDAPLPEGAARFSRLSGYVEGDFAGSTPGNVVVSSSSVGFRLRQAFGELAYGNRVWVAAGQAFSLMTPPKNQISVWPSDYQLTQAVDTNYIAGLTWTRQPQVRVTLRPSTSFNWAFGVENPEQQVGKGRVTWPACCGGDLDTQYNTGDDELSVPNLMPDMTTRVAFNRGAVLHADVGGVLRVFRHTLAPYDDDRSQVAGGVSANVFLEPAAGTRLLLEGSWGAGIGRYQGGLAPDVIVRADGSIEPVRSGSWVGGVEGRVSSRASWAGYYSGVYVPRRTAIDTDGSLIGYGYDGSPGTHNRIIHEATGTITWYALTSKDRGSMQLNTQVSWLARTPWSRGARPVSADALLFFTQLRYNLP